MDRDSIYTEWPLENYKGECMVTNKLERGTYAIK